MVPPKLALLQLKIKLLLPQGLQYYRQMPLILLQTFRIDQDVVDEDHHKLVQVGLQNSVR